MTRTLNLSNVENRTIVEPEQISRFGRKLARRTGLGLNLSANLNLGGQGGQVGQVFLESSYTRARIREVYVSTCPPCPPRFKLIRTQVQKWRTGWAENLSANLSALSANLSAKKGCSIG